MNSKGCRILCFGDSLTSGYLSFGLASHPYSTRLQQRLHEARPGCKDQVNTDGEPGEQASSVFMKTRLRNECTGLFSHLFTSLSFTLYHAMGP